MLIRFCRETVPLLPGAPSLPRVAVRQWKDRSDRLACDPAEKNGATRVCGRMRWSLFIAFCLGLLLTCEPPLQAQNQELVKAARRPTLTLDGAIRFALERNPELIAIRQQHGIAAAGIVIAYTYPFNPVWEAKIREANGPESAGVTNQVSNEHKVFMDRDSRPTLHSPRRRECHAHAPTGKSLPGANRQHSCGPRFETVVYRHKKKE